MLRVVSAVASFEDEKHIAFSESSEFTRRIVGTINSKFLLLEDIVRELHSRRQDNFSKLEKRYILYLTSPHLKANFFEMLAKMEQQAG